MGEKGEMAQTRAQGGGAGFMGQTDLGEERLPQWARGREGLVGVLVQTQRLNPGRGERADEKRWDPGCCGRGGTRSSFRVRGLADGLPPWPTAA